ncbi:hypothetical protein K4K52_006502 [Colletotrichum sp. SAR 10_76]|nr:hypothetical protein K4K52_006502 [Colletotrichum sp. SAR 10_76]
MDSKPDTEKINDLGVVESNTPNGEILDHPTGLRRDFKPHQVFMFSIACAIGTGLVIGSGTGLSRGGPGSLFISYSFLPMNKGFGGYATRIVDPAFGFATGWNYFLKYVMVTPTNLTAAGLVIRYWRPDLNVAIWITVFGVIIVTINVRSAQFYPLSGIHKLSLEQVMNGTEVVGMTFGETPNPRKNVPKAVRQTFWRIACFYIIGVLVLGMAIPYDNEMLIGATKQATSGAASPFVVSVQIAGIGIFPDIINGSLLVFTLSAASSDIYCSSRTLYGLARDGQAPRLFAKTRENGNPVWAVAVSSVFIALGYMNASKSASTVFGYLVSLVTVFAVLNWVAILVTHIRFRRALEAQGIALSSLPYVGFLQPYGSYFALFISLLIVVFNGYDAFIPHFKIDVFILKYIGLVVFGGNIVWWKFSKKTTFRQASAVDLVTGRRDFEEIETAGEEA